MFETHLAMFYTSFTSYRCTMYHVPCTMYSVWYTCFHVPYTLGTLGVEQCGLGTPDRFLSPRCQFPHITPPPSLTLHIAHCPTLIPSSWTLCSKASGRTLGREIWNWQIALLFSYVSSFTKEVPPKYSFVLCRNFVKEKKKRICLLQPFIQRQGRAIQRVRHSGISLHSRKIPPFDFDDIRPDTV